MLYLVWWSPAKLEEFNNVGFYGLFHTYREALVYKEEQEKSPFGKGINGEIRISQVDIYTLKTAVFEKVKNDN